MTGVNCAQTITEAEMLSRISRGDQEAFAYLYDAWSGRMYALIVQILVDRAQSEEVLQEVFLEIWQRAPQFDADKGSGRAWMVTIARRRAIDRVRSSQRARERENSWTNYLPDIDSTLAQVEERLAGAEVHEALAAIGEPHKTAVALAYFTGMTHVEIAEYQGVPVGTAKTRIRDGIKKLRTVMGVEQ
ncbi:sigma-70 family RNA polymerase sigma factor [Schaalia sp. Marseille-Q2122]|uniref:sigma-70 family RNA polymerase sigma factor n=1 Tax=Schaalia sp. Marseille-Q2122 TaxID=2736604 RepID=UPI00158F0F19|nr:sigma-70 family RNA polymerase sigma factor [Schaalia sp. Marseille-Q2122]